MRNKIKRRKEGKKKIFLLVITFFIFTFLFSNVNALGITPGRTSFEFEPDIEKIVEFRLVNTENKAMNISLKVGGEWSDFVILNQTSVKFNADEYMKTLSYKVRFPSSIDSGGIKAKIIASETASNNLAQGTTIGINIAVEHQLYVLSNITAPEKEEINVTKVFVKHYQKGEPAKVEVEIINPSAETMKNVYSTMLVYDRYGLLRSQFNSTHIDIEPNKTETIEAYWDTYGFEKGDYGANLIIYYNNKTEEQGLIISLGSDRIEIGFGKFEFEKHPTVPISITEIKKINPVIIALIVAIILFIIVDIIVFIYLKKKTKKIIN
ncbi:MAG: hypothetical protein IB618_00010 [Candidatus Pacearchaeota archaeon]|nr:MAG: hypothetical protein IB618_00010 [Candidatus Pacearchaeota archaeon]